MLILDGEEREALWNRVNAAVETYITQIETAAVAPVTDAETVRTLLAPFDFTTPRDPLATVDFVAEGLWRHQVHTPHPAYFGLFNPASTAMGIAADTLVAAFNPQLAAWSHNPFANEIERHLIRSFGTRFGYTWDGVDGTFTSGGAEANHTALLTALAAKWPEYRQKGLTTLGLRPTLYLSTEAHHSFIKAARLCGLGDEAVRTIPVNSRLQMDVEALKTAIAQDREAGFAPFLLVGTAGTTSAGIVDPLPELADVAGAEGLWFHADAAWGGAAALVPELQPVLHGIERADSITFDAHKWLSVPMGAGLYITRHRHILTQTFGLATSYMPRSEGPDVDDPYAHSMQWSRRSIGLKVFLSLAVAGWEGYAEAIRHQTAMANLLREEIQARDWEIVNPTPLPLVCFVDARRPQGRSARFLQQVADRIVTSGSAWISTTRLAGDLPVLRACVTNYRTQPEHIHGLVSALEEARSALA